MSRVLVSTCLSHNELKTVSKVPLRYSLSVRKVVNHNLVNLSVKVIVVMNVLEIECSIPFQPSLTYYLDLNSSFCISKIFFCPL